MFGMGYVINHCIALFQKEQKEKITVKSLTYIAQGVQCVVNGLANEEVITPFSDYLEEKPEDIRTADEVVNDVLNKCGLLGG